MKNITDSNFVKMCQQGMLCSFLGIIGGTLLGIFIYALQFPLLWLSGEKINPESIYTIGLIWQSASQPGTLGACFGAIIGALFGCILVIKEIPRK